MKESNMADIHNLLDDMAFTCEEVIEGHGVCGSTKFNLLKSGKIECAACGYKSEAKMWFGVDNMNGKVMAGTMGIMALTKDDFLTVVITLMGLGLTECKNQGMDGEEYLKQLVE